MIDRDQSVSQRSKPNSRTLLIGEQPNPWKLLQLQERISRHRGAKLLRQCLLLEAISLLSPAYLLSIKQSSLSIQNYWVIKIDIRPCLTYQSNNQAHITFTRQKRIYLIEQYSSVPPLHFRRGSPQSNYQISLNLIQFKVL